MRAKRGCEPGRQHDLRGPEPFRHCACEEAHVRKTYGRGE